MGEFLRARFSDSNNVEDEKNIDNLLTAAGIQVLTAEEVKEELKSEKNSIKKEKKIMENKTTNAKANVSIEAAKSQEKKQFKASIDGRDYVVKRCYVGTDGKLHIAPEHTLLAFVEVTKDGKQYPVAEVSKDGGSWFKQLLLALASRITDVAKKSK